MEKFAAEATLTVTIAGLLAVALLPLAFALRWKTPHAVVRGAPERWPGWLILLFILLVMIFLPGALSAAGSLLQLFRFLDFVADPSTPLRPTVQVETREEWSQLTASLRSNYVAFSAMPILLLAICMVLKLTKLVAIRKSFKRSSGKSIVSQVILCWAMYGLPAIMLNIAVQYLFMLTGWTPTIHPIAKVGIFDGTGGWITGLGACVSAPLFEELIFRRWLLPWAMRRRVRNLWLQLVTLFFCSSTFFVVQRFEVMIFGLLLFLLQAIMYVYPAFLQQIHRLFRSTTFAANWATSSVFAMMHASVWPSPIALMVLSMGLGFLVVRTGRWWTAVLCHSLFNFTSLMVLYASQGAFGATFKIAVT